MIGINETRKTLEKSLYKYLEYLENVKHYADNTINNYEKDLTKYIEYLIKKNFKNYDLNYEDAKKYVIYLNDTKNKKTSISRMISALRSFYKYLVIHEIVKSNPFIIVSLPKKEHRLPKFLYHSDIKILFESNNLNTPIGIRNNLILELMYSTGVRVSELVNIKIRDIDLYNNTIKVLGKGNKERMVIFGKQGKEALTQYLKKARDELLSNKRTDFLLINHIGNQLTDRGVRFILDELIKKACLNTHYSPHALRHTFATHMIENGAELTTVKELLGHVNLSTTGIYTHVTNERLRTVYLHSHPRARDK